MVNEALDLAIKNEKEYLTDLEDYIMVDILGFCGCGSPEIILGGLEKYLSVVEEQGYLEDENYLLYAYVADKARLTDHGLSVYSAWLTEKGKKILQALRENKLPSNNGEITEQK